MMNNLAGTAPRQSLAEELRSKVFSHMSCEGCYNVFLRIGIDDYPRIPSDSRSPKTPLPFANDYSDLRRSRLQPRAMHMPGATKSNLSIN